MRRGDIGCLPPPKLWSGPSGPLPLFPRARRTLGRGVRPGRLHLHIYLAMAVHTRLARMMYGRAQPGSIIGVSGHRAHRARSISAGTQGRSAYCSMGAGVRSRLPRQSASSICFSRRARRREGLGRISQVDGRCRAEWIARGRGGSLCSRRGRGHRARRSSQSNEHPSAHGWRVRRRPIRSSATTCSPRIGGRRTRHHSGKGIVTR